MSIVRPGLLGDKQSFKQTVRKERKDDSDAIQTLVKQSMIRNRRSETTNEWTKREIDTIRVDFTEDEMTFIIH